MFRRSSVDLLISRAKEPASQNPSIDSVISTFCAQDLKGKVTPDAVVANISAAHADCGTGQSTPHGLRHPSALTTALQASLTKADGLLAPLLPVLPNPNQCRRTRRESSSSA